MLKSLELFGFKSFADRTTFEFHSGITGVVGPNGSGKSNVVDAIKWILGDQSPKSLRGKEMTDVIFNGAAGRKPAPFAEATLTFDNTSELLPLETSEVHIGRRLWRNGDSEYLINRTPARLKDVRDLFLGTGAGAAAYCIIEQGRVDQILQANATNRRQVFEEAAGISRYKARKTEALRKLERVDQNLVRLTDIVEELQTRLNSLRNQAAKASKFRQVSAELQELWLGLAADDARLLTGRIDQAESAARELAAHSQVLEARQHELEAQRETLDADIAAVDDRLRSAEREIASCREQLASRQTTIRHCTARQEELDADLIRLRRQRLMMQTRVAEISAEREHHRGVLERFEAEHERFRQAAQADEVQVAELTAQMGAARQRLEEDRQRLHNHMREASDRAGRAAALQSQCESVRRWLQAAEEQQQALVQAAAACREELLTRRQLVAESERELAEFKQRSEVIRCRRQSLSDEHGQFEQTLLRLRQERMQVEARKAILEDLELRQEGLGVGVKEILNRAETSHYPPWSHIHGSVADLIDVDLEHAALLELALGNRAQLIVLDRLEPLIEYLNSGSCTISGRVGFIALDDAAADVPLREVQPHSKTASAGAAGASAALPDLSGQAGVVERADRFVLADQSLRGLVERLLGDTWVVESLGAAQELAASAGQRCRFVTLQGELLSPDGTLYAGTIRSESALVSRKSELRRLRDTLFRLDGKIEQEQQRLAGVGRSLSDIDNQLEDVHAEVRTLLERLSALKNSAADAEHRMDRLQHDLHTGAAEVARLRAQQTALEAQCRTAAREQEHVQAELARLQAAVAAHETGLAEAERQVQALLGQQTATQLDLAKREERLSGLRESHARMEKELDLRLQQRDEAERRLQAAQLQRRDIVLQILNTQAELSEVLMEQEVRAEAAADILREKTELRRRRAELQKQEHALRKEQGTLTERLHEAEMQARELRQQLAALGERISEEYQLQLDDVVASGASAFRRYLETLQEPKPLQSKEHSLGVETAQEPAAEAPARPDRHAAGDDAFHEDAEAIAAAPAAGQWGDAAANRAPAGAVPSPQFPDVRGELEERVHRLRRKLKLMGNVDTDSLNELEELEQRYSRLKAQWDDLVEAKSVLEDIIRRINAESKRLFLETFESVRGHFLELFRKLFGGGEGNVILEDPQDVLECGIDIVARPPGKELRSISLLSGGEKTMTAVALLLAIFKSRPSPFCILDECDAALDEANVDRFVGILKEFQHSTQFILVTHRKPTMAVCDVLHGVTMEQSGVSKRMSVRFEDVNENGEFCDQADSAGAYNFTGKDARQSDAA